MMSVRRTKDEAKEQCPPNDNSHSAEVVSQNKGEFFLTFEPDFLTLLPGRGENDTLQFIDNKGKTDRKCETF